MPPRNPRSVQLDFPQLTADIIQELRLLGTIGLLDFKPEIQPVYIVSARGGSLDVISSQPVFTTAEIFSDQTANPAINAVLATTGALPAGDYDVKAICTWATTGAPAANPTFDFQHRDAADAVTLARVPFAAVLDTVSTTSGVLVIDYATTLATNERLRWQALTAIAVGNSGTVIMARRRLVP